MANDTDEKGLVPVEPAVESSPGPRPEDGLAVGQWYWAEANDWRNDYKKVRVLWCITHIGSNFAELESVGGSSWRIHFDNFEKTCTRELNAQAIIDAEIRKDEKRLRGLMGKVQDLTAQLAIGTTVRPGLPAPSETQALALRGQGTDIGDYKKALVKAKDKTLPELFKEIEKTNESMATWMKANLIPLKAQAESLKPAIKAVEARIFNVELYAGLTEQVEQIADGAPAPMGEQIRLFQRRAYMDEECLLDYRTGGMEFKNLGKFDQWLVEPQNLARLLPFPRCIVAFKVRRRDKEREIQSLRQWIDIVLGGKMDADRLTFLYMRNGEKVYRLNTEIEFGEQLFPDFDAAQLTGKFYAKMFGGRIDKLVPEGLYLDVKRKEAEEVRKHEERVAAWEAMSKEEQQKDRHKQPGFGPYIDHDKYVPYTPDTVWYDDITAHVKAEMDRHNRLVLVLQGVLDRSPVFHPHPPWPLWEAEGFARALQLVYDDSRALTPGEKPDFEAYRAELNASLAPGCITVGQEDFWEEAEAEKENTKRRRGDWERRRYRPTGNPGPGTLARVVKMTRGKVCTFRWTRERVGHLSRFDRNYCGKSYRDRLPCAITVPEGRLLNVSAYTPGDFKRFFADPRTRADYLKWAPYLLEAEEYHAGNRKVDEPDAEPLEGDEP